MKDETQRYMESMNKPPFFSSLRSNNSWVPRFYEVEGLGDVAIAINVPHEDFPYRVLSTAHAIRHTVSLFRNDIKVSNRLLRRIHGYIFPREVLGDASGQFRQCNVTVGEHNPPSYDKVPKFMNEMEQKYNEVNLIGSFDNLIEWYYDFETIHPFVDGNGRTGGVIVAALTYLGRGGNFMAPCQ